jgi:single-strand DNA-binding protein
VSDNQVTQVGRLTANPELKFLNSGSAAVKFNLAVEKSWKNKSGDWEKKVSFFSVVAYGTLAENAANSLAKGSRVIVTGTLEQRSWETDDGSKRSVVEINADAIGAELRFDTVEIHHVAKKTQDDDDEAF